MNLLVTITIIFQFQFISKCVTIGTELIINTSKLSVEDSIERSLDNARKAIEQLRIEEEPSILQNIDALQQNDIPLRLWSSHRQTDVTARQNAYAALISIATTKQLQSNRWDSLKGAQSILRRIKEFCPLREISCDSAKYRTVDGTCNNVLQPIWGSNGVAMQRLINPFYANGVDEQRVSSVDRSALPNVRHLSNILFKARNVKNVNVNMLLAHWAHFVYTDLVHIGSMQLFQDGRQVPLPCCSDKISHPECQPITIDHHDRYLECLPYTRTAPAPRPNCELGPREQVNQATSFLDASMIYGSTKERTRALRVLRDGQLVQHSMDLQNPTLHHTIESIERLVEANKACILSGGGPSCWLSGSDHNDFLPPLTILHTLWIRQHNRIARKLSELNPNWSDDQLFEESRRIVIAQLQHITYNEFLPIVLGREQWVNFGLKSEDDNHQNVYNIDVNPSVINGFAAAVGQFFFTMFESRLAQYDRKGMKSNDRPLSDYFFNSPPPLFSDESDGILRYILHERTHRVSPFMTDELRNKLFKGGDTFGYDLAAIILQTGRDHGIPPYTVWREYCDGTKIEKFDDLNDDDLIGDKQLIAGLANLYNSVKDVDLFILGLAEKPMNGALLGPTFSCILGKQFQKAKFGDRFWYEIHFEPSRFSQGQLAEVKKTTLTSLICANFENIGRVQPRSFELEDDYDNYAIDCNNSAINEIDWKLWSDDAPKLHLPITPASIARVMEIAKLNVDERRRKESTSIEKNQIQFKSGDPLLSYGKMMRAKREATELSRISEVLLQTTKLLMTTWNSMNGGDIFVMDPSGLQTVLSKIDIAAIVDDFKALLGPGGTVEKCLPKNLPCDHTTPYRTASGWCNNLRNPHFANAFGTLTHLLPPAYEDGIDAPRALSITGVPLPSPRVISNAIHFDLPIDHTKYTHMVMQFGQILDHEITHSPVARGPNDEILNCTRCDSPETISAHCMPLPVPAGDPHFPVVDVNGERRCLPFARSLLGQLTLGYRNQLNQLTPYLDGSAVYGSTECEAAELRSYVGGGLKSSNLGSFNREALPQGDQEQDCRSKPVHPCFVAGDERNSHQPGLTTMHNIFLREHNRIAKQLEQINEHWGDEKIYQETRRILSAEFAHVTYNEYVPKLLGSRLVERYELRPRTTGYFDGYDETCDASVSHPFATAAFRFGHTLVRRFFSRFDTFYRNFTSPVDLVNNFNNMEAVYDGKAGSIDSLLIGLLGTPSMAFDRHISAALRNHLFDRRGEPTSGMDLISLNILRARDHGVQPYNAFRELCGLKAASDFDDLANEMEPGAIRALESVYAKVDDIDLFPGLLSERPTKGALLPPTMACIIAEQFRRLKKCDRFFYENNLQQTRFTKEQLAEIRGVRLATVFCANSNGLIKIQPDVFTLPDDLINSPISCDQFKSLDLSKWMDKPVCYVGNLRIERGRTKRLSPCQSCTCTTEGARCTAMKISNCEKLIEKYAVSEVIKDTACIVQCAKMVRKMRKPV